MDKSCENCIRHSTCYFVPILKDAAAKLADSKGPFSIYCSHPVDRAKRPHVIVVSEKREIKYGEIIREFEKTAGSFCDMFKKEASDG
jgi:hypothetical protein